MPREIPEQDADLRDVGHVCDERRWRDLLCFPLRIVEGAPLTEQQREDVSRRRYAEAQRAARGRN